ncbi:MAG: C10 family peptidase [Candidatus Delongbacteria bacterium]|nr:C10 family peptidase [Candidatus Delongbacteria bacterium]
MKKFLVAVLVISAMLSAAFVDQTRAKKVAENYYKNYAPASAKGNTVQKVAEKLYNGQVTWYAVSFDQGFVIVSADDAVRSILGYSYDGEITEDLYNMQNPFINRFDAYDKQIVEVRETGYVDNDAQTEWKNIENNIFPKASKAIVVDALVESRWGQGWPMNTLCPLDGGVETAVGCVATAMHQIMRFHRAPLNGISSHSYFWTGSSSSGTLAVTFSDYSYDYDLMPLTTSSVTQAELDELSKLSYHCGVSVDMDYDIFANGGSGAYSTDVVYALETYFGFSTDATYISVNTPTDPTVQATNIQTDLDNSRPIYWSGSGVDGGHAFILDGYTNDYWYHFNWGWNGSSDGWFQLTSLNPNSDFTSSQAAVFHIWSNESEYAEWPAPSNLGGSIANGEDVTLTWTAPAGTKLATLTGYKIFRGGVQIATTNASTTTYLDADLSAGYYNYLVKATYSGPDGESHISNNYYAAIVPDENYPIPLYVEATVAPFTRQDVDLVWTKPFTLPVYFTEDWETTSFETDWLTRRTTSVYGGNNDNFQDGTPADPNWFHEDGSGLGVEYIHSGSWSAAIGYTAPDFTWLFSPFIDIGANSELRYWVWCTGNAGSGWLTNYYINLYNGDMTERNPSGNVYNVAQYIGIDEVSGQQYETEVVVDLSAYTGSYRIAFVYDYTDGFQMAIDDIMVAAASKRAPAVNPNASHEVPERIAVSSISPDTSDLPAMKVTKAAKGDEPTSYDIYRNGSFVENVAVTGASEVYSDIGFVDGNNEYFVKALYPTGTSIASARSTAFMDANPKPDYLTGILNGSNDVDLSWYKPYSNPPMWYTYAPEFDSAWDFIDGYETRLNRTRFLSDLGYFYPCTVDSIAAAFYEYTDDPWLSDQFTFKVYTTDGAGADSLIWGPSPAQTATSGFFNTLVVPSLYMVKGWWVEIDPADNTKGHPAIMVDIHDEAGASTSSSTYLNDGATVDGWYSISFGDEGYPGDWMIMSYITSATAPDVTKSGWVGITESMKSTSSEILNAKAKVKEVYGSVESKIDTKGMTNYNIYRNGSLLGTSALTTYTDLNPVAGDNTYYVTAAYTNPVGESAGTNSVVINVTGGPVIPEVPANVVTSIVGSNLVIDWDVSADATGYDVYSSDDPYGTFTFTASVGTNQYTVAASQAKLFYYIIATNTTKK